MMSLVFSKTSQRRFVVKPIQTEISHKSKFINKNLLIAILGLLGKPRLLGVPIDEQTEFFGEK